MTREGDDRLEARLARTDPTVAGTGPPFVPADQSPPDDMPPISLMVLDSLADDIETVDTMRNCGEVEPNGLALVGESYILDALRSLLANGLVEASEVRRAGDGIVYTPLTDPAADDDHLRVYWYEVTPAGRAEWERGQPILDAYWDKHPI